MCIVDVTARSNKKKEHKTTTRIKPPSCAPGATEKRQKRRCTSPPMYDASPTRMHLSITRDSSISVAHEEAEGQRAFEVTGYKFGHNTSSHDPTEPRRAFDEVKEFMYAITGWLSTLRPSICTDRQCYAHAQHYFLYMCIFDWYSSLA